MLSQNNPSVNGHTALYLPCPSDYPAVSPKPELPKWRDEHPKYVHSMEWHDSLGIKHMLVFRDDSLDEVLREARMIREFVKAARARDERPVATAPQPEPQAEPEPEQAESVYSGPEPSRLWCERHQTWLQRREKNGNVWYSHKTAEGWCRRGLK